MKKTKILLVALAILSAVTGFAAPKQEPVATPPAQPAAVDNFASQTLTSDMLAQIIARGDPNTYLIDVRTAEEYRSGAIPSALNIPFDVIAANLPTQDRTAKIVVYCRSGNRSSQAKATLEALGFTRVNDFGAVFNWRGELERR